MADPGPMKAAITCTETYRVLGPKFLIAMAKIADKVDV